MVCEKCNSQNVKIDVTTETELKKKHHGIVYWLLVGWWLQPILWVCLTLPMIIISIFKPKNYKMESKTKKIAVCQDCGYSWEIK